MACGMKKTGPIVALLALSLLATKGAFGWGSRGHALGSRAFAPAMVVVPPASPFNLPGMHKVEITYNYDPSRRLRFYQFDPVHHDVAVFSVH